MGRNVKDMNYTNNAYMIELYLKNCLFPVWLKIKNTEIKSIL